MFVKAILLQLLCITFMVTQETNDPFVGKYVLVLSENYDEFLKELGINYVIRQLWKTGKPVITIEKENGDVYTMKTATTIKTLEIKFKLGEEFDEVRLDGSKVKSKMTADGNKLIHIQYGDKEVNIERQFSDDGIKEFAEVNGVKSSRIFKRQ